MDWSTIARPVSANRGIDDRREEPWPTAPLNDSPQFLPYSPSPKTTLQQLDDIFNYANMKDIQPLTRLGIDLGGRDVGPLTNEQILQYLINNSAGMENDKPEEEMKREVNPIRK